MGLSKGLPIDNEENTVVLELAEVFDYIEDQDSEVFEVLGTCLKKK